MAAGKRLALALGLTLIGFLWMGASAPTTVSSSFRPLVDQIVAFFPRLAGDVVEVKGAELILSLGRRDGVQAGMEFSLFREGRELKHPKTGALLGRVEEMLGLAMVSQVFETYAIAAAQGDAGVRPGDRARITAGKVALMVMALTSQDMKSSVVEPAVNQLWDELTATERFQLVSGDGLAASLAEEGIPPERVILGDGLEGAAGRYRVSHLLVFYFSQAQAKPFIEARLFSFRPGRDTAPLLATGLFAPPVPRRELQEQFASSQPLPEAQRQPKRSFLARLLFREAPSAAFSAQASPIPFREVARLNFASLSMDAAVSPGDRVPRLVVTDGQGVFLYRVAGRTLEPEWTYAAGQVGRIVSVQLADLDGDGVLEVVANRYNPQPSIGLTSFILTSKAGKPTVVVRDLSQILLAVDASGEGIKKTLWAQPFTPDGFFLKGQVERYSLKNGALVSEGSARVPSDFRATGATMSNIAASGPRALAYVDSQSRLVIAVEGEESWKSAALVGGAADPKMLEVFRQLDPAGRSFFYSMEPMPLAVDLDGDGIDEIVVPQNQVQGVVGVVFRGPTGYRMHAIHTGFEGIVTGLGAVPGQGTPVLLAAVVRYSTFLGTSLLRGSGETRVIMSVSE